MQSFRQAGSTSHEDEETASLGTGQNEQMSSKKVFPKRMNGNPTRLRIVTAPQMMRTKKVPHPKKTKRTMMSPTTGRKRMKTPTKLPKTPSP